MKLSSSLLKSINTASCINTVFISDTWINTASCILMFREVDLKCLVKNKFINWNTSHTYAKNKNYLQWTSIHHCCMYTFMHEKCLVILINQNLGIIL